MVQIYRFSLNSPNNVRPNPDGRITANRPVASGRRLTRGGMVMECGQKPFLLDSLSSLGCLGCLGGLSGLGGLERTV